MLLRIPIFRNVVQNVARRREIRIKRDNKRTPVIYVMCAAFCASGSRGNDNLWRGVKLDKKRLSNVEE